jgi:8-oxo-dGTP pyrophosphatase MutT (NUDIX family)
MKYLCTLFINIVILNQFNKNIDIAQFIIFCESLKQRLSNPLPGSTAHLKMASRIRLEEMNLKHDSNNATISAVLVLLYLHGNSIHTSFILRPKYDGVHSGQVAFPGGRKEKEDKSVVETAVREAQEEVNIDPSKITVLGTLTDLYIPPSNYLVTPVVAFTESRPDFIPQVSEVAEIIEANISFLFDELLKKQKTIIVREHRIEAPYYEVNGHVIWGATAMILSELEDVIKSLN